MTAHKGRDLWPTWSPDGTRLAFASSRRGNRNLFVKQADGSGKATELLISPNSRQYPNDWSRDENTLLFMQLAPDDASDLFYLRRRDDRSGYEEIPFRSSDAHEGPAQLSPDGRFLAYVSDESGQPEVYLCAFPEGEGKQRASVSGGGQPRWRADGKELFYVEGHSLMSVAVSAYPSFTVGPPVRLFESEGLESPVTFSYDVSPDGERFVLPEMVEESDTIVRVTQNWYAEFKGRDGEAE